MVAVSYTHLDVYKRQVYDLDENGERIKLPSGRWKSHKEDTVDWNDQKYCEIWRHEWEVIQNRYLEAVSYTHLDVYKRQEAQYAENEQKEEA